MKMKRNLITPMLLLTLLWPTHSTYAVENGCLRPMAAGERKYSSIPKAPPGLIKGFADFWPKIDEAGVQIVEKDMTVYVTVDFERPIASRDVRLIMRYRDPYGEKSQWLGVEAGHINDYGRSHRFKIVIPKEAFLTASKGILEYTFAALVIYDNREWQTTMEYSIKAKKQQIEPDFKCLMRRNMDGVCDIEILTELVKGNKRWGENDFISLLEDHIVDVAELDDTVVGFVVYKRISEDCYYIVRFGVHPDFRRQGVGTALINDIKERFFYKDEGVIRMMVNEYDEDVISFLRTQGFRCIATDRNKFGQGIDGYLMEFRLRPLPMEEAVTADGLTKKDVLSSI